MQTGSTVPNDVIEQMRTICWDIEHDSHNEYPVTAYGWLFARRNRVCYSQFVWSCSVEYKRLVKNDPENIVQDRLILWRIGAAGGVVLYVAISIAFIFLGRPNADEGWYLLASKMVLQGQLPYRDFAFTQMPLLPYIYGIPQILFSSSIVIGRVTSVILSLAAFTVWLYIAKIKGRY